MEVRINRRALLIANPGEAGASNYCKGVFVDIAAWRDLLKSAVGGAWVESEIVELIRPSVSDVRREVLACGVNDYSLIAFSGHGWYSSLDRDRILELRKGEEIASIELRKGANKRTILLDSCQKVIAESVSEKSLRTMAFSESAGRQPNISACKTEYLRAIGRALPGIVVATSCTINETASDDDQLGGRYSGSLFQCIDQWKREQSSKHWATSPQALEFPVAHECAAARTRQLSANQQNPSIEKPRSTPYFPIAVFA